MFFLLHQYRVLGKVILFGYWYAANVNPSECKLKVFPLNRDAIVRHVRVLARFGFVTRTAAEENNTQVLPTAEGLRWYRELRKSFVDGVLSFVGSIVLLLVGILIGRIL